MLERIEIENLGSIRNTGLSLSPLTVLLGANASGKSTVLRGISLFAALRSHPLHSALLEGHAFKGTPWPRLIHGGETSSRLAFRGFVQPGAAEPDYEMQLGVNWERVSRSILEQTDKPQPEPEFLAERLRDPANGWIQASTGPYTIRNRTFELEGPRQHSLAFSVVALDIIPGARAEMEDLFQFVESFGEARYFRPHAAALLSSTLGSDVSPEGRGFVTALAVLQNRDRERFAQIEQRLSELFPHIRRIRFNVDAQGMGRVLVFDTLRSKQPIPGELEADGVLTTLFFLWAGATTTPHGTLLIDEPEAALHPHLMGKRVQFLRSLAQGEFTGYPLRVVVATQSVDFVRWLEPSEVRVVEYSQETGTLVHAIPESETLHTLVDKFQTNTGDLWYSGALGGVPGPGA